MPAPIEVIQTEGVCGGSACVGHTRIAVWILVEARRLGLSDEQLLLNYPSLTPAHLEAAWTYYAAHHEDVDRDIAAQDE